MPSSIGVPLEESLTKHEVLLKKLEDMLSKAKQSVALVEQRLPLIKEQTAKLAADLGPVHETSAPLLTHIHNILTGIRDAPHKAAAKAKAEGKKIGTAVKHFFGGK